MWLAGAVAVVIVAVVAIQHLTTSALVTPAHGNATVGAPEDLGIPFGASAALVRRRLGQPNTKKSGCWIYKVKNGAQTIGDGFGQWVDEVKYCFGEGAAGGRAVSNIYSHMVAHRIGKKRYPAGWSGLVTIAIPPKTSQ
jgi:hypothetical protein